MGEKNCKLCFHYDVCYAARRIPERAEGCSKYAPDVQEVRHGHWVEWYPPKEYIITGEEMLYCCSVCDAKYEDVEGYKYCPYCGADMRGDK